MAGSGTQGWGAGYLDEPPSFLPLVRVYSPGRENATVALIEQPNSHEFGYKQDWRS
jgi:hypothetical protein